MFATVRLPDNRVLTITSVGELQRLLESSCGLDIECTIEATICDPRIDLYLYDKLAKSVKNLQVKLVREFKPRPREEDEKGLMEINLRCIHITGKGKIGTVLAELKDICENVVTYKGEYKV